MGMGSQSHPYRSRTYPSRPTPIHFVIHRYPSPYQFLSSPVDVVFTNCPMLQNFTDMYTAVDRCGNIIILTRLKHHSTVSAINCLFTSSIRHFTGQFTLYSNACSRILSLAIFLKCFRSSRRNRFHPRRIRATFLPIPTDFPQNPRLITLPTMQCVLAEFWFSKVCKHW